MPRGGYRPGSGNKKGAKFKGTKEKTEMREQFRAFVAERVTPLMEAIYDRAIGHWMSVTTKEGKQRVYKTEPETNAAEFLFDQAMGKAPQTMTLEGEVKGGIIVLPAEHPKK